MLAQPQNQHPQWILTDLIASQGLKRPRLLIDAVSGQMARTLPGGVQKVAGWIEVKDTWRDFAGGLAQGSQCTGCIIKGEASDAIVAPVRYIQKFPGWVDMDLGAGIIATEISG